MHSINTLILDLALITIYAGLTTLLFKKLKQPTVLGYLLAGILVGMFFSQIPNLHDKENVTLWADIGVIFLLFSLGLEFSFSKMVNVGKSAMITAIINVLLMLFLGYHVGILLGWSKVDSFFLGSMISMSSTTIIIKTFDDLNIKKQKFTDLVFGILVVEDLVGVLLLVLLPMVSLGQNIDGGEILTSTLKLLFFLVLCFIIGIYIIPTFLKKIENIVNDEMLLLITVGLCFGMVISATYSGFSAALGAFLMGSILSETVLIHRIEKSIKPLKDFFGAIFFVSVGMMVDPTMFVTYAFPIFVISVIVILGIVSFSTFGLVISGQTFRTAIHCSFSLAQVGEFAFIIATLGMSLGVLNERVYPIIVAVSVITTFLTPIMIKSTDGFIKKLKDTLPDSWIEYLNPNKTQVPVSQSEERLWTALFKSYLTRMALFSMILSAIIYASSHFFRPFVYGFVDGIYGKIIVTSVTLLVMAPFLKALIGWEGIIPELFKKATNTILYSFNPHKNSESIEENKSTPETGKDFFISNYQVAKIYQQLWGTKKTNRLPLIVLTSLRLLTVCSFIITAVHQFLTEDQKISFIMLIISITLLFKSKWLMEQYMKMEIQFLKNLKGSKKEHHHDE